MKKILGQRGRADRPQPDDLWVKCRKCGHMSYRREFVVSLKVCQKCGFHERLTAHERLEMLVDSDEAFQTIAPDMVSTDPLGFVRGGVSYDEIGRAHV